MVVILVFGKRWEIAREVREVRFQYQRGVGRGRGEGCCKVVDG
jgi:hypothetical protein